MHPSLRSKQGANYVQEEHLFEIVSHIRSTFPGSIFVTAAELSEHLFQIVSLLFVVTILDYAFFGRAKCMFT